MKLRETRSEWRKQLPYVILADSFQFSFLFPRDHFPFNSVKNYESQSVSIEVALFLRVRANGPVVCLAQPEQGWVWIETIAKGRKSGHLHRCLIAGR